VERCIEVAYDVTLKELPETTYSTTESYHQCVISQDARFKDFKGMSASRNVVFPAIPRIVKKPLYVYWSKLEVINWFNDQIGFLEFEQSTY